MCRLFVRSTYLTRPTNSRPLPSSSRLISDTENSQRATVIFLGFIRGRSIVIKDSLKFKLGPPL